MGGNWQTPAAIAIVVLAAAALLRSAILKKKKPGCGGDCGCPTDKFKSGLKH